MLEPCHFDMVDEPSFVPSVAATSSRRCDSLDGARQATGAYVRRTPAVSYSRAVSSCVGAAHASGGHAWRVSGSAGPGAPRGGGRGVKRGRAIRLSQGYRQPRWWRPPKPRASPHRRHKRQAKKTLMAAMQAGQTVRPSSSGEANIVIVVLQESLRKAILRAEQAEEKLVLAAAQPTAQLSSRPMHAVEEKSVLAAAQSTAHLSSSPVHAVIKPSYRSGKGGVVAATEASGSESDGSEGVGADSDSDLESDANAATDSDAMAAVATSKSESDGSGDVGIAHTLVREGPFPVTPSSEAAEATKVGVADSDATTSTVIRVTTSPQGHSLSASLRPGVRCNGCSKVYPSGSKRGISCSTCCFNLCGPCSRQACPQGHRLTAFETSRPGFGSCDGCRKAIPVGAQVFGCNACNYDLCKHCSVKERYVDTNANPDAAASLLVLSFMARNRRQPN